MTDQIIIVNKTVTKKYLRGNLTGIWLKVGFGINFNTLKIVVKKPVSFVVLLETIIDY
jgi:hypothetical protein